MTDKSWNYAICVCNTGYEVSLELRKVYEVVPDPDAGKHGLIRIIDESGEDYLHPASFFVPLELPASAAKQVSRAA